jgi:hypothetical protein
MNLRRLNEQGIALFFEYLNSLTEETPLPYPDALLTDPELTEEVTPQIEIEQRTFGSRYAAAAYFFNLFKDSGLIGVERDRKLWAWLSLFYFDEICPVEKDRRAIREFARYLPEMNNYQRYYRHILAGSYLIYFTHSDDPNRTRAFLCQPLHIMTDIIEQLASRQELVSNRGIIELTTILYYDTDSSSLRRGARSKGQGTPRRLADILNQYDVTWDLYNMSAESMMHILPDEFDRFRSKVGRS